MATPSGAALPPSPGPPTHGIRPLFTLRPAPRRWPSALRASICMGVPLTVGWLSGHMDAGMMASLGAFTSLYGSGRPYLNRAGHLALIALSFALAVALGMAVEGVPLLVVPTVVVIAMVSTYMCSALRVGPPGAYMFTLACAAGTTLPTASIAPWHAGLLVLAGGAVAWVVHMVPAVARPRGPEGLAVAAAVRAVAAHAAAVGSPRQQDARHRAALALNAAWTTLVTEQPTRLPATATLRHLQGLNRRLHLLFARSVRAAARGASADPVIIDTAVELVERARQRPADQGHDGFLPLGAASPWNALRAGLRPGAPARLIVLRVGVAALLAGIAGGLLGLERAYWAVAAAVLVLHAGLDWIRTVQRGAERMVGTWVGLLLAGAVLVAHPQGPWLVLVVMVAQFVIEVTVMRNYSLAVVFITVSAVVIAAGAQGEGDIPGLLLARGVDTTIGCAIGVLVFFALRAATARNRPTRIPDAIVAAVQSAEAVIVHVAAADPGSPQAHRARHRLQSALFAVGNAYTAAVGGSAAQRRTAEQHWPAVTAVQELGYGALAACWMLEHGDRDISAERDDAFGDGRDGMSRIHDALAAVAAAVRDGSEPAPLPALPRLFGPEIDALAASLPAPAAAAGPDAG
ncbi:FUSC family protein [Microbacterium luticocti]|uniref:FUSC family protein n=1 Tax=Microbacterium luticocti TaxID=451764 RepID=UPI000407D0A0|nr:FUSC family protein [Microbacterium luticocti]